MYLTAVAQLSASDPIEWTTSPSKGKLAALARSLALSWACFRVAKTKAPEGLRREGEGARDGSEEFIFWNTLL